VKILVTGGAGFIGSNLVDALVEEGHQVVVVDNLSTGKRENIHARVKFYKEDIASGEIMDIFEREKVDVVYHLAAQIDVQKSIIDPVYDGSVNILGTINILEACKKYGIAKIIYASSAAVYGEPRYLGIDEEHSTCPMSYYGLSKYTPEKYIAIYSNLWGLDYTILRYANVYGIRQDPKGEGGVVSIFMDKMFKIDAPVIFGDGSATRDFVYVEDVVRANILALDRGSREIFNIGTGKAVSVYELFSVMKDVMKYKGKVKYGPERQGDIKHSYFKVGKAKDALGWEARYSIEEGLVKTVEYYSREYGIHKPGLVI